MQLCDLVPLTGSTVSIHVLSVPPFARLCKLALVRAPSHPVDGAADLFSSFSDASAKQLHSLSWDRPLKALILGTEKVESRSMSSGSKGKDKSQNAASMTTYVALYPDSYTLSELEAPVFPVIDRDASDVSPVTDLSTADTVSFNAEMLAEGLVTLSLKAVHAFRKGPRKGTGLTLLTSAVSEDFIQKLEAAEATVKRSHFNLYKYGDPIGNSDDDFGEPYGFTRGKGFEGGAKQSQGTSSATTSASQAGKKK